MTRRALFAALASLPFVGRFARRPITPDELVNRYIERSYADAIVLRAVPRGFITR